MKVKYAVFFQPVGIPTGKGNSVAGNDLSKNVNDTNHDIVIEHPWVKITHRDSKDALYVSIYNLNYVRPYEAAEPKPAPAIKKAGTKPGKQAEVVDDKLS